jgi:ABC-type bacteriocin/lantibiotic exporter with double-glycine peptidase domain
MQGRTTFIIAHRFSALKHCDVLLMIEDGRLITVTSDVSMAIDEAMRFGRQQAVVPGSQGSQ